MVFVGSESGKKSIFFLGTLKSLLIGLISKVIDMGFRHPSNFKKESKSMFLILTSCLLGFIVSSSILCSCLLLCILLCFPGSRLPHLLDGHRDIVGCTASPASSCPGPVRYRWASIVELEVPPDETPGLMTLHLHNTNVGITKHHVNEITIPNRCIQYR